MNTSRKRSSFMREAGFGLLMSLAAAAIGTAAQLLLPTEIVLRMIVAGLSFVYLLRTLGHSQEKTGRVFCVVFWALVTAGAWVLGAGFGLFLVLQILLIWLFRSLYSYSTLIEAAIDLGLCALAACFAIWAALRTESLFLTTWCFLLLMAVQVAVPKLAARHTTPPEERDREHADNRAFSQAMNAAENALQRLAVRR